MVRRRRRRRIRRYSITRIITKSVARDPHRLSCPGLRRSRSGSNARHISHLSDLLHHHTSPAQLLVKTQKSSSPASSRNSVTISGFTTTKISSRHYKRFNGHFSAKTKASETFIQPPISPTFKRECHL